MKSERKQLEIMENQLKKAMAIVLQQKKRYEELNSEIFPFKCEDAKEDEIALGILGAIENIEHVINNIYNI